MVEIRAAEGGDDAKLLVQDLFKVYIKWCKIRGFGLEKTDFSKSETGWARVEFLVTGKNVYELFLPEAGGHRFQRVPPTEKRGRRQTSTVTVSVLPVIMPHEVKLNRKELEWNYFNGEGKGGQNRNKVEACVRLTHKPSGIMVVSQSERKRKQNERQALQILEARLQEIEDRKINKSKKEEKKRQVGTGQRGDKVRTYRFQDDIVTNHLNGKKHNLQDILSGNLDILR